MLNVTVDAHVRSSDEVLWRVHAGAPGPTAVIIVHGRDPEGGDVTLFFNTPAVLGALIEAATAARAELTNALEETAPNRSVGVS